MGKFKLLLNVVEDIRSLAGSLEELINVVETNKVEEERSIKREEVIQEGDKEEVVKEGKRQEAIKEGDREEAIKEGNFENDKLISKDTEKDSNILEHKEISLEEVRAVLAKKSQEGFTDEIRAIIKDYNCNKLSEVNPKYYLDILQAAEVFKNE